MTNEELVLAIKNGDDGLLPQLWEQVRRFIAMLANRYYKKYGNKNGCELDDLIQSGYFALIAAVKYYKPEKGFKFTSYLGLTLKNAFNEALGIRSSKQDRLDYCTSLDAPIGEDGDTTLIDMIGDLTPGKADLEELIVEKVWNQELRAILDEAMTLLSDKQRELLTLHYYFGLGLNQIAEMRKCSRQLLDEQRDQALWRIYNSKYRKVLREFLPCYGSRPEPDSYRGTGFRAWKETGCSSVETFLLLSDKQAVFGTGKYAISYKMQEEVK